MPSPPSAAVREPIPRLAEELVAALGAGGFVVDGGREPDVLVWSITPDGELDALQHHTGTVPIVALLDAPPTEALQTYLDAGAHAVLGRGSSPDVVVAAALLVVRGHAVVPYGRAEAHLHQRCGPGLLDRTELRWMRALAEGASTNELAAAEGYSERDLYRHLRVVYAKLGAESRVQALLVLAQADLLHRRPAARGSHVPRPLNSGGQLPISGADGRHGIG